MAMQTRRTIRRSVRILRATVTTGIVAACCGLLLFSAVSAHAASINGLELNGWTNGLELNGVFNGLELNGVFNGLTNGLELNGVINGLTSQVTTLQWEPLSAGSQESFPFTGLSQRALGKPQP